MKGAVAIDFGVYVYPISPETTDPVTFIKNHGANYGYSTTHNLRILKI